MGLLDILNGMQNGPRGQTEPGKGGMSPVTMGLLALLAYKAYQKMSAGSPGAAAPNAAPAAPAPSGGLGGLLGGGGGLGSLLQGGLGGLGGLLAGSAGGSMLNGGLQDLLQKLEQNGLETSPSRGSAPARTRRSPRRIFSARSIPIPSTISRSRPACRSRNC